jgi:hypothetical protein
MKNGGFGLAAGRADPAENRPGRRSGTPLLAQRALGVQLTHMGWAVVDPELCFAAGRASRSTGAASRNAPEVAGAGFEHLSPTVAYRFVELRPLP